MRAPPPRNTGPSRQTRLNPSCVRDHANRSTAPKPHAIGASSASHAAPRGERKRPDGFEIAGGPARVDRRPPRPARSSRSSRSVTLAGMADRAVVSRELGVLQQARTAAWRASRKPEQRAPAPSLLEHRQRRNPTRRRRAAPSRSAGEHRSPAQRPNKPQLLTTASEHSRPVPGPTSSSRNPTRPSPGRSADIAAPGRPLTLTPTPPDDRSQHGRTAPAPPTTASSPPRAPHKRRAPGAPPRGKPAAQKERSPRPTRVPRCPNRARAQSPPCSQPAHASHSAAPRSSTPDEASDARLIAVEVLQRHHSRLHPRAPRGSRGPPPGRPRAS